MDWGCEVAHVESSEGEVGAEMIGDGHEKGILSNPSQNISSPSNTTRRKLKAMPTCAPDLQHTEHEEQQMNSGEQNGSLIRTQQSKAGRIHILGTGKDGKFLAHSLASMGGRPPISLLLHRPSLVRQWYEEGQILELLVGKKSKMQIGFDIENSNLTQAEYSQGRMLSTKSVLSGQDGWIIDQLIVTTEAQITVHALSPIKDRLHSTSTILFLQNSMGLIDEVNDKVFPNAATRPRYIEGMTSHGLQNHPSRTFTAVHYRRGDMFLAFQGGDRAASTALDRIDSTRGLLRSLTRSPVLNAKGVLPNELLVLKLERLAVEAVIGPLSVMFDCKNGDLLSNYMVTEILREVLKEISMVVCALPELKDFPGLGSRFDPLRLERMFVQTATKTSRQLSDMVQSVRKGKKSEVGYFTGYILKRGKTLGIDCPSNTLMARMVRAKTAMRSREANNYIPFENVK